METVVPRMVKDTDVGCKSDGQSYADRTVATSRPFGAGGRRASPPDGGLLLTAIGTF